MSPAATRPKRPTVGKRAPRAKKPQPSAVGKRGPRDRPQARPPAKQQAKPRVSTHPAKTRTRESQALIAKLRAICLAHPDTTEQIAWGEPTWRVNGKIFAQLDDHHHGSAHVSVWLPAPEGAQAALIDAEPDRIFRPPYVGHAGWIGVILDTEPDWAMVEALVAQSHALIASRKRKR